MHFEFLSERNRNQDICRLKESQVEINKGKNTNLKIIKPK